MFSFLLLGYIGPPLHKRIETHIHKHTHTQAHFDTYTDA